MEVFATRTEELLLREFCMNIGSLFRMVEFIEESNGRVEAERPKIDVGSAKISGRGQAVNKISARHTFRSWPRYQGSVCERNIAVHYRL